MKKILSIIAFFTLLGCSQLSNPVPFGLNRGMYNGAPEGSESFRSGWKAGCDSGMAAYGPLQYKYRYSYTYDENMLDNEEYHNAWRLGFRHCRWYVGSWTR